MNSKEFSKINLGMSEEEVLNEINKGTLEPLKLEDIFIFKVKLCDSSVDRVFDKLTPNFLKEFAEKANNLVGLYDHNWEEVSKQQIRLFKTLYIDGEIPYVLGYAYTLSKNIELIEKIKSGILKEVSIGFNSSGEHCSICGGSMHKDVFGFSMCENGHEVGEVYGGKLCVNLIEHCEDALEFSLVSVPANSNAKIIKTFERGINTMKKSKFNFLKFISQKEYTPEDKEAILGAIDSISEEEESEEISEEEIKSLIEENSELKAINCKLVSELEELKKQLENKKQPEELREEVIENIIEPDNTEKECKSKGLSASITPTYSKGSTHKKSVSCGRKGNYISISM